MSYNIGDNPLSELYTNLATAKQTAEAAKTNESDTKASLDTLSECIKNGTSEGGEARKAANDALTAMHSAYSSYTSTISSYEQANQRLNALMSKNPPASEEEINSAKDILENAKNTMNAAYEAYVNAQKDWQTKDKDADEAEGEDSVALEQAVATHSKAVEDLKDADAKVTELESEIAQKKADIISEGYSIDENGEVVGVTKEIEAPETKPLMTEDEAIKQGYTVIKSYEDLLKIGNNLGGKYILMGDIEIPDGVNWTPIGNADSPFTGIFDGNGCNIKNLNIQVTEDDAENIGFFGVTDGATISNVNIVDAKVNGKSDILGGTTNVGILAGLAKGTNFDNITVSGEVTGYAGVGGLTGAIDDRKDGTVTSGNSSVNNCHTNVNAFAQYYTGGLIGYIYGTEAMVGNTEVRREDHRGIATQALIISNCTTSGTITAGEESVGGLVGEAGKTILTLENCTSNANLHWANTTDDSDLSFLLETGRIGGMVGNIDGTYITIANCEFNGSLNGDTEFQSEVYGWYMDDAHVAIWDIPGGLPVDDILKINGIDGMKDLGNGKYQCTVSTISGLDKMVAMIKEDLSLADKIVWQINFDFDAMDGAYDYSEYAQYGIVQHLYQDENDNVHNDVYIDNECDLESTYHTPYMDPLELFPLDCKEEGNCKPYYPSMIPGLWKDDESNYYVFDDLGIAHQVNLDVHSENQITDIQKRLTTSEVQFREKLVEMGKAYQRQMHDILRDMFKFTGNTEDLPILTKAEYKKLVAKAQKYGMSSLTEYEKLGMAIFEVDYAIMNAQALVTRNLGCGMGGNASFLDKTTTYQMYDEQGRALYTDLNGAQLVGVFDEDGNVTGYQYADSGEAYTGKFDDVYEQRAYQKTDADGNLLFASTSEDGTTQTVTQIKGEDGSIQYVTTDADGNQVEFDGDIESLTRELEPCSYANDYADFETALQGILQDLKDGKYPKDITIKDAQDTPDDVVDTDGDGVADEKELLEE